MAVVVQGDERKREEKRDKVYVHVHTEWLIATFML